MSEHEIDWDEEDEEALDAEQLVEAERSINWDEEEEEVVEPPEEEEEAVVEPPEEEEPAAEEEEEEVAPPAAAAPEPEVKPEPPAAPAPVPEPEASPAPVPEPEAAAEEVVVEEVVEEEVIEEEVQPEAAPAPESEAAPEPEEVEEEVHEEEEIAFEMSELFEVQTSEDSSSSERRVDYQAALSQVLLVDLQNPEAAAVASAASKLDNFFELPEHNEHTDCFCSLGGHGLLLMLLQKWQNDQVIQERLFSCLAHLSKWARTNDDKVLSTILIMRGMNLMADSMARFPDSSQLHVDCLVTITCLCRKEDLDRHATTRDSITGAVPLVCTAIKIFPENRAVLHNGCKALKAFCSMKLTEIKDLKGEAISVVGAALHNFPDDAEINKIAFSFLRNLGSMCGYETEDEEEEDDEKDKKKKDKKKDKKKKKKKEEETEDEESEEEEEETSSGEEEEEEEEEEEAPAPPPVRKQSVLRTHPFR